MNINMICVDTLLVVALEIVVVDHTAFFVLITPMKRLAFACSVDFLLLHHYGFLKEVWSCVY